MIDMRKSIILVTLVILFHCTGVALTEKVSPTLEILIKTREIVQLINRQKFAEAEERLKNIRASNNETVDGSKSYHLACYFIMQDKNLNDQALELWRNTSPQSHYAFLISGLFHNQKGWDSRGGKWASEVPKKQWATFENNLRLSKQYLEKAAELDSSDPESYAYLLTIARGLSLRRREMEYYFRKCTEIDPTFFYAYYQKMLYLSPLWHGSFKKTIRFVQKTLITAPQNSALILLPAYMHHEVLVHIAKKNYLEKPLIWNHIESAFLSFFTEHPESFTRRVYFAEIANDAKKYDIAKKNLDLAILLYPKNYDAYLERGRCYLLQEKYDLAIEDLTKALETYPEYLNGIAYYYRAKCFYNLKKYEQAIQDLKQNLQLTQNPASSYYYLGECFLDQGKYPEAIGYYTQAIEHNKKYELAIAQRGYAYGLKKDYDKAILDYKKIIKMKKKHDYLYNQLGYIYLKKGLYSWALAYFNKSLKINPKDDYAQKTAEWITNKIKEGQEKEEMFIFDLKDLAIKTGILIGLIFCFLGYRYKLSRR